MIACENLNHKNRRRPTFFVFSLFSHQFGFAPVGQKFILSLCVETDAINFCFYFVF